MTYNNPSKNGSGYYDGVASRAIRNADREAKRIDGDGKPYNRPYNPDEARCYKVLKTIFAMCDLAGFHVENRIVLKDKSTGRIFE